MNMESYKMYKLPLTGVQILRPELARPGCSLDKTSASCALGILPELSGNNVGAGNQTSARTAGAPNT